MVVALSTPAPAGAQVAGQPVTPIPTDPLADPPEFVGAPATSEQVDAPPVPRHPFMAPNGLSNLHDDGYQTDTYDWSGPRSATSPGSSTPTGI